MPTQPKILAFAGSLRTGSWNKKLVRIAADAARAAGAAVTVADLRDYPLPVYDEDLESASGLPAPAMALQGLLFEHHGLLIASPEYNSSVSAALKNAIDWISRPSPGRPGVAGYAGKVAGIMAASPGALGGLRGLVHLRSILGNIDVTVLPGQFAVSKAHEAFAEDGSLKDPKAQAAVQAIGTKVAVTLAKLLG